ncbi:MAG: Bug family tripartite tricarboxylate transporter substrate binding protein [Burkholderiaceae bacterium]
MKSFLTRLLRPAAALLLLAASCVVHAQSYPTRPVRVVFPYPPGSPLDAIGRMIIERAGKSLGQPMVFENKPGANGILGQTLASRAAPDGYTILLSSTSAFLLNSFVRKDLQYHPVRSFTPITAVADIPVLLIVSSRVPAGNTREFVQYLKANPTKVNYGSVGNGSFNHVLMEQFKTAAGVEMLHVPYQGAGAVATELLAGRIDASVLGPLGPWTPDQVKLLTLMSTRRSPVLPNVPAITEELPSFRPFGNWMGFFAPTGTPEPIVRKLSEAFNAVLQQPDVRAKIEEQKWSVIGGSPDDFRKAIASDLETVGEAFKSANIKPE